MENITQKFTNIIQAQSWINEQAQIKFDYNRKGKIQPDPTNLKEISTFKKGLLISEFSRFKNCNIYKILIGEVERDARAYYYQPYPF